LAQYPSVVATSPDSLGTAGAVRQHPHPHQPGAAADERLRFFLNLRVPKPRASDRFIAWIQLVGIRQLAKSLGVSRVAVQNWKTSGTYRRLIRIQQAFDCVVLSLQVPCADGKPLTIEDIYGNPIEMLEELLAAEAVQKPEAAQ
jgi:hypothetical protein